MSTDTNQEDRSNWKFEDFKYRSKARRGFTGKRKLLLAELKLQETLEGLNIIASVANPSKENSQNLANVRATIVTVRQQLIAITNIKGS